MKNHNFFLMFLSLFIALGSFVGCAMAPLTGAYSARPLGKGNVEFDEITSLVNNKNEPNILPLTNARIMVGVSDVFDMGVQADQVTSTILGKYSLYENKNSSWHQALLGGITHLSSTEGWFFGAIGSYKYEAWEPYLMLRFFEVTINSADFDYKYITQVDRSIRNFYLSNVGFKYWLKPDFALGTEYSFALQSRALGFTPSTLTNLFVTFQF